MSATDPDTQYHRARHHLAQAGEKILDAYMHLQHFCDQTQTWADFTEVAAPTVADLAERHSAVATVRVAVKGHIGSLAAQSILLDAAWKAHAAAMRQVPQAQPVSDDPRISAALAARFDAADDAEALEAIYAALEAFGLEPEGPGWAQWALEVRYGQLYWAPFLPPEPETPVVWPQPIEAVEADTATPERAADLGAPAAAGRAPGLAQGNEGDAA